MQRPHGVAHARTMRTTRGLDARTLRLEPGGSSTSRAGKITPWSTLSDAPIESRLTPHVSATARFRLRVCEGTASPRVRFVSVPLRASTCQVSATCQFVAVGLQSTL